MAEENIGTVAESAGEAESFNDEEFVNEFLFDGNDHGTGEEASPLSEEDESAEAGSDSGEGDENHEAEEEAEAESDSEEAKADEEKVSFTEHGKSFSVPKTAVEGFAKAVGRSVEDIIDIYQKGCGFDKMKQRFEAAKADSEIFEKVAAIRGITAEQAKKEMWEHAEAIPFKNMTAQIKRENPGISDAAAAELAKYRIAEQKPKAEEQAENPEEAAERTEAKLRELDLFMAKHAGEGIEKLPNQVIEAWEKSGIDLEKAYEDFKNKNLVEELRQKVKELEAEKKKATQKSYAKEHSPGSAKTAAGKVEQDPFLAELFSR